MTERTSDQQPDVETQLTQPKKGKPIEIPVPRRKDVLDALERAARTPDPLAAKAKSLSRPPASPP
jgi:hypothetical protein